MAGAEEDEVAPPAPHPVDPQQPIGQGPAAKRSRSEHHHGAGDAPSFRMEDLPVDVQAVIMSLLPLKEAVRTSIVSTSWRMIWTFRCNLSFKGPRYLHENDTKIQQAKCIETVNCVIQQHSRIGINKFSIRCGLFEEDSVHLDRWIRFAASSKAKIIHLDLRFKDVFEEVNHLHLEALLDAQGSSFLRSLFLGGVVIKPHSAICGFTILRRLVLQSVTISGDFTGFLANCAALEDLEMIECSGLTNLIIPQQLDKLQHLLIDGMEVEMVEFYAADLSHFEYKGQVVPIVHHGCSKLKKATIMFSGKKGLAKAFTAVPSILPVKILNVRSVALSKYSQLQKLPTRPDGMFMHLRHMTCRIIVHSRPQEANYDIEVLQLAYCLDAAPQLETLQLNMFYVSSSGVSSAEVVGMRRHDHLKTVFMSGFRCYKAQIKLACCILENASVLEKLTIEPRITGARYLGDNTDLHKILPGVCEWAQLTSERFGKVINVSGAPLHKKKAGGKTTATGSKTNRAGGK
ncbi:hypothetical protein CFC21_014140 [Triticum aestivum]|uniref:F-box domain-containing protein n=2 Tax=Triticum aestivum TaxID=4565 RepID=A0A3B6A2D6_WHEAT|nr:F-box/FBD/LRR-repeat protein At2g04230-like isoform X1 [Triticum aestivum]KAF6997980.1 hypothetical protein CFC21_014140 [Triticum aestivum]